MTVTETIGMNLRAARKRLNLTQHELALQIGTQAFQVSRWEQGRHRPSDDTLMALASVLGMTYADFYAGPDREAA